MFFSRRSRTAPTCVLPSHPSFVSAAHLVKPEWLSELITLSTLDPQESTRSLEHNFSLPPESKFCPGFAADLSSTYKTLKTWQPNEARLNMLKGYRFVFVGEKGLEIPVGYRDLVKRGGAEYESFTVSNGVVRWRKALFRAKTLAEDKNAKVSPVADTDAMELAVGAEEWKEFISIAESLDVEFIQPENILQAIASIDTFFVDSAHPVDTQAQAVCPSRLTMRDKFEVYYNFQVARARCKPGSIATSIVQFGFGSWILFVPD